MQLEPLSRRRFLQLGLITGAAATTALSVYMPEIESKNQINKTPYGTLLVLNQEQARVMHAFVEAVLPNKEGYPSASEAEVVQRLDEELFFISDYIVSDLKLALNALEWMPMFYGYFSRFSRLSITDRLQFLNARKETSSNTVRAVINNCRMISFNFYYGHESTWSAIGYDGAFAGIPPQRGVQRRFYAELIGTDKG